MAAAVENKVLAVPQTAHLTLGASFHRTPMAPGDYGRSGEVASWLSPTGEQRSLPTNIRAVPSRINNNSLRSARCSQCCESCLHAHHSGKGPLHCVLTHTLSAVLHLDQGSFKNSAPARLHAHRAQRNVCD